MNRIAFENYLTYYVGPNGKHLNAKAIASRLKKANEAEQVLKHTLDVSVATDVQMRTDLIRLRTNNAQERRYGQMQNALRKYYHMAHAHWFPRLRDI